MIGGNQMDETTLARIQTDPNYIELVASRKAFGWTLTIIMLVIYYGFIALVAFAKPIIGTVVFGSITLGLPLGVAVIFSAIILTGIYVVRANGRYDDLTAAIVDANTTGAK